MKLSEIEVGKSYYAKVPMHVDVSLWHHRVYNRVTPVVRVVEVGVYYDVPQYVTYGGLAGTPRVCTGYKQSSRADGVKIAWDAYGDERTGVVPCRNIEWEATN
jgi:hypothetical protein